MLCHSTRASLPTDLQNVNITLRILFRPVTAQLPRIFTSIGEDYDERVLPSITTEILKSVVVRTGSAAHLSSLFLAAGAWNTLCFGIRLLFPLPRLSEAIQKSLHLNSQSLSLLLPTHGQLNVWELWERSFTADGAKTGRTQRICHFWELPSHSSSRFQARFDAGELITQRELVSRQVSEDLTERAATFGLILDDVSLVRVLPFRFFSLESAQIRAVEKRVSARPEMKGLGVWTHGLYLSACSCMGCGGYSSKLCFCHWPSVTLSKPLKAPLCWLIVRLHCCEAFVVQMRNKCFWG